MDDKEKLTEQLAEGVYSAAQAVRALLQGDVSERVRVVLRDISANLDAIGDDARPAHCSGLISELMAKVCDRCEAHVRKVEHAHDANWCNCEERVCESCIDDMAAAYDEASFRDYHGSSSPQTQDEQHRAAWLQKEGR